MNRNEIRNEISRLMRHTPLCASQRKENPGECNCYHTQAVDELHDIFIQVLKGNR